MELSWDEVDGITQRGLERREVQVPERIGVTRRRCRNAMST